MDKDKVQQSIQLLLEGLGVDLDNTHYRKTAERGQMPGSKNSVPDLVKRNFP